MMNRTSICSQTCFEQNKCKNRTRVSSQKGFEQNVKQNKCMHQTVCENN